MNSAKLKLLSSLSLRNLFRQKRRSLFLGLAIGFGVTVLIILTSFASGMVDLILNKMMVYSQGHIKVTIGEKGKIQGSSMIRDKVRIMNIISNEVKGIDFVMEDLMIAGQAVGNGKSGMLMVVGVEMDDGFLSTFPKVKSGSIVDMTNGTLENPVIIGESQAKGLNVKARDKIRMRLRTVSGQEQTALLSVASIVSAANPMMTFVSYLDAKTVRSLLGYAPQESGALKIVLKKVDDQKKVIATANRLYEKLVPGYLGLFGTISANGGSQDATLFGVYTNNAALNQLNGLLKPITGSYAAFGDKKQEHAIALSRPLAVKLGVGTGSPVSLKYMSQFGSNILENNYVVTAVFDPGTNCGTYSALTSDAVMAKKKYYEMLPRYIAGIGAAYQPAGAVTNVLAREWKLLDRTSTTQEMMDKMRTLRREKPSIAVLDVATLYESMEIVNQIGNVVTGIAIAIVLILFFIILIGVFNTLRMTIRERTREIGTIRAIGMQRGDVLMSFVFETSYLALFASAGGTVMAFILMFIASRFTIVTDNIFSMFLYERHLYFLTTPAMVISYIIAITFITAFVTFWPARRAANLSASDALRHYE
ncbi:MAG: FtsX-like permease family protein [Spirochaetes bacterium]|nr:FtsX-like permease family protein [Spirochaetota bacterium]